MIYYLAHPYSNNPRKSYRLARRWTWQLRRMGLTVFSPILHTHKYHTTILSVLYRWFRKMGRKQTRQSMNKLYDDWKNEDYVAWDLELLERFKKDDGVGKEEYLTPIFWEYDSGVTMLLADSAYIRKLIPHPQKNEGFFAEEWEFEWLSDGCRKEYEYCKQNHIRILDLNAFLHGEEKDV